MQDHRFAGKTVLPAVESLRHLAGAAVDFQKDLTGRVMGNAVFGKFLEIFPGQTRLEVTVKLESLGRHGCRARLATKKTIGSSNISRTMEHADVCFYKNSKCLKIPEPESGEDFSDFFRVSAPKIYDELVPFGPQFHNLTGDVKLSESGVEAKILVPRRPEAEGVFGSVFVLDAAFHAASVWVQRYRGFVGFPVSFGFRVIADPADPGEICSALLIPLCPEVRKQSFDIWIRGSDGRICEYVKEMGMRDVFAGRKNPPAWIKSLA